jgi:hypothetical protein
MSSVWMAKQPDWASRNLSALLPENIQALIMPTEKLKN